jgi:hypothetical protein
MNPIDTHDPDFQDFVVHNIPVWVLLMMVEQYRAYLMTARQTDQITVQEIQEFERMLDSNKIWGE